MDWHQQEVKLIAVKSVSKSRALKTVRLEKQMEGYLESEDGIRRPSYIDSLAQMIQAW